MNSNDGLILVAPRVLPPLDPAFRPAVLVSQRMEAQAADGGRRLGIAVEQADGSVFHHHFSAPKGEVSGLARYVERLCKFMLWSRGGHRVYFAGDAELAKELAAHYSETRTGKFDAEIMGGRIYERPFEVIPVDALPPEKASAAPLGRHMDGCRIGFDLGGSDRKASAVIDGKCVFTEEIVWNPVPQKDPQWHFDGIMDSLKRAAANLPRVDAIGGSSAGVYVNNRVKVASLFRGVPADLFESRVKDLFLEIRKAWGGIPLELANDGEVTALAGSMSLGANAVLGLAMGTSTAGGYVNADGNITTWLNELAFVPVDYNPGAAVDEWSGDYGCGAQYFSQQAVGRLTAVAGIDLPAAMPLPEKLKAVQELMASGDHRAARIYETIGVYLGYTIAHFSSFYDVRHVLVLGRVMTGTGGELILERAREVLKVEFPQLASAIQLHTPDEKDKRHGQAVAAASLPSLG